MAKVKIDVLVKLFGKTLAVDHLSLTVQDRELMVIVGPSGCGKTTTLNCIAGLESPDSGRIYFDDSDVTDYAPHQRNVAMVFQSSMLYPHLTGRENIRMSLVKSTLERTEIERRVDEAASIADATAVLDRLPAHMSGGERQRVAIAKAIVRSPAVFLMDEPLANLDAALRETLRSEISVVQKRIATTMVLVTHDQVEAMTMGDRIAVMWGGTLQQVGTPDEVYNSPSNTLVARFIGSPPMHLFQGELLLENGGLYFRSGMLSLRLPDRFGDVHDRVHGDRDVILGVRPHHMSIGETESARSFHASVYAVERMGKETIVTVTSDTGEKIKVLTSSQARASRGDKVSVSVNEQQVMLFSPATGANLYPK